MKKAKRIISLFLTLLMLLTVIPMTVFNASAQECPWDFWIDGKYYSSGSLPSGISISGHTITLTNYTGGSIAALPGGTVQDDDWPVMYVKLVGTNTLTGGYFSYYDAYGKDYNSSAKFYSAIYSAYKMGGYGDEGGVVIGGSGTLNINITHNTFGYYMGITGDNVTIADSAKVNINMTPKLGSILTMAGIFAYGTVKTTGSSVLNVNTNIGGTGTMNADVRCIVGDLEINNTAGYVSLDSCTINGLNCTTNTCSTNAIRLNSATAGLYMKNTVGRELPAVTNTADLNYFSSGDDEYLNYAAYTPVTVTSCGLRQLPASLIVSKTVYSNDGDVRKADDRYTFVSNNGNGDYYMKQVDYKRVTRIRTIGGKPVTSYSYSGTFDNYAEDNYYQMRLYILPAPGTYYVPGESNFSDDYLKTLYKYVPISASSSNSGYIYANYYYKAPVITKQPDADICGLQAMDIISVEADAGSANTINYKWQIDAFMDGGMCDAYDLYDCVDGRDTNELWMIVDQVDGINDTVYYNYSYYRDLNYLGFYCELSTVGGYRVSSNYAELTPSGHAAKYTDNGDGTHSASCLDADCSSYGKTYSTSAHTDYNKNGKCDLCDAGLEVTPANAEGLTASAQTVSSVTLKWNSASGANNYRLYKYDTASKSYKAVAYTDKLTYTFTGLTAGTTYKFAVRPFSNTTGKNVYSAANTYISATTLPDNATGLKAETGETSVKLTWNTVSGANYYRIYKYNKTTGKNDAIAAVKTNTYTFTGLTDNTQYTLRVRPFRQYEGTNYYSPNYTSVTVKTTQKGAPANATGLTASAKTDTTVTLKWNKAAGATHYRIYRYDTAAKTNTAIGYTTALTYTVKDLKANTSYTFNIRPFSNATGSNIYSPEYTGITVKTNAAVTVPANAAGLTASAQTVNSVTLTWNAASGATHYRIYKYDTSTKQNVAVGYTAAATRTFTVTGLTAGTTYKLSVRPFSNASGSNVYSADYTSINATTLPSNVTGLSVYAVNASAVAVKWTAVPGATAYAVYKYNPSTGKNEIVKTTTDTKFTVTGLSSATSYTIRVRAYRNFDGKNYYCPSYTSVTQKTK